MDYYLRKLWSRRSRELGNSTSSARTRVRAAAVPCEYLLHPQVLPAAVLAIGLVLYVVDCLINGMVNPIYTLIAGGLAGLVERPMVRPSQKEKLPDIFPLYVNSEDGKSSLY